jgi:hypothetical protein
MDGISIWIYVGPALQKLRLDAVDAVVEVPRWHRLRLPLLPLSEAERSALLVE